MSSLLFISIVLQGDVVSTGTFIQEILGSPVGSFASVLGMMILAGWLIYFVTKHTAKFKCDSDEHRGKVGKVEEKLDGINRDIAYIRGSIDLIRSTSASANPTIQAHSPVSLTDYGKKLAEEMELSTMIQRNWERI